MRIPLRWVAAGWCLVMVLLLTVVQFTVRTPPPLPLYLLFSGVWVFGAVMIMTFPRFGAVGTALYGVILGIQVLRMHGGSALNLAIAVGSLMGTGFALAYLMVLRRQGAAE